MLLMLSMLEEHVFNLSIKKNLKMKLSFVRSVQQPRWVAYIDWLTILSEEF
jgi:hypothetical protein